MVRERESPTITGIGVSAGRVLGPVVLMSQPIAEPPAGRHLAIGQDRDVAADRITTASAEVQRDLMDAATRATGKSRELLETTALMAADPS
jgi:phosphotransferase system enzyme I (PtsI)